jgi:hypothetical protein
MIPVLDVTSLIATPPEQPDVIDPIALDQPRTQIDISELQTMAVPTDLSAAKGHGMLIFLTAG